MEAAEWVMSAFAVASDPIGTQLDGRFTGKTSGELRFFLAEPEIVKALAPRLPISPRPRSYSRATALRRAWSRAIEPIDPASEVKSSFPRATLISRMLSKKLSVEIPAAFRHRSLAPPRPMTGTERRHIDPNRGVIKLGERYLDIAVSRFVFPLVGHFWSPYCWILKKRFTLTTATLSPVGWPAGLAPLRVLLITDIHTGIFLQPATFNRIAATLMQTRPDLVLIGGDLVTGHVSEATPYLAALATFTEAPLGAWFCFGNHDYFGGDPQALQANLAASGIRTLLNASVRLRHHDGFFVLGGIDDLLFGKPDWEHLQADHGVPHLLLAHNPDHFYAAVARAVPLMLSGHTHGGQIRLPNGPPIIRQSRFCLDEGAYVSGRSTLVVSRGFGSVALPLRWGADPEAVLLQIVPPGPSAPSCR